MKIQEIITIIQILGYHRIVMATETLGVSKAIQVVKIIQVYNLNKFLSVVSFEELVEIANLLTLSQLRKWFRKKTIEETIIFIKFLGIHNITKIILEIGIEKILEILELLSIVDSIRFLYTVKKMKLPRITKRQWEELENFTHQQKKMSPSRRRGKRIKK